MRTLIPLLLIAVTVSFSTELRAESTAQMLSACRLVAQAPVKEKEDSFFMPPGEDAAKCWGFFMGLQSAIVLIPSKGAQPYLSVCAPPQSTRLQFVTIFVRYADENPQRLHEDVFLVALDALRAAFPCGAK